MRKIYKGPIIYEATTVYTFSSPSNSEEMRIKWWDAVDYIGVLGYYPLTRANNPTVDELKDAWVHNNWLWRLENLSKQYQRPVIISEIGYGSADGTNIFPLNYLNFAQMPLDLQEQADCYEAAFQVLLGKPWLKGIFWWDWPANPVWNPGGPKDKNYVIIGKPASDIVKKYYLSR